MTLALTSAADGLARTRVGVGRAASDVVRAAQSASGAYQQTADRGTARATAPATLSAPRFTPPALPAGTAGQSGDLATASVELTRAEFAYKATAAAFKATAETMQTLLDTIV